MVGTMKTRCGERGFTLLELMIAVSILSIVMLTALSALKMVGDSMAAETLDNAAYSAVERVVGEIAEELHCADITLVSADRTTINYQIPVDLDGDGTVFVTGTENVEYGFELGGMPRNGSVTYSFVATETVSELALGRDLNGDGDSADVFDLGHMAKVMTDIDAGRTLTWKRGNWLVQPSGAYGGDIDGDGDDDPIFEQLGNHRLRISLWSLGVDPRIAPRLANSRSSVYAVND